MKNEAKNIPTTNELFAVFTFMLPKNLEKLNRFGELMKVFSMAKNVSLFGGLVNGSVAEELRKGNPYQIFLNAYEGEESLQGYLDVKGIKLISARRIISLLIKRNVFTINGEVDLNGLNIILERARKNKKRKK